jgi:protein CpxP
MKTLKNMITGSILSTLLLTFMGTALAQDTGKDFADSAKKGRHHQRGNQSMPAVEQMMRGIRHLDLSDEQKANIRSIMKNLKAEERPLAKETKAGHEQLKELIKAESFDELAVTALAEHEGALTAERLIIASRAMSAVYGQLTDEQRMKLGTMATKRAQRRAGKRGQRSAEGRSTEG